MKQRTKLGLASLLAIGPAFGLGGIHWVESDKILGRGALFADYRTEIKKEPEKMLPTAVTATENSYLNSSRMEAVLATAQPLVVAVGISFQEKTGLYHRSNLLKDYRLV